MRIPHPAPLISILLLAISVAAAMMRPTAPRRRARQPRRSHTGMRAAIRVNFFHRSRPVISDQRRRIRKGPTIDGPWQRCRRKTPSTRGKDNMGIRVRSRLAAPPRWPRSQIPSCSSRAFGACPKQCSWTRHWTRPSRVLFPLAILLGKHVMIGGIDAANDASVRFHERRGLSASPISGRLATNLVAG